jgi:hypothetical protein
MKRIIFILCIFIAFITCATAGEIYTYKDKDGNTVISNTPIPEKYEKKAKKIESYKPSSPEEIQRYNAEQAAIEKRLEAESSRNRQINEAQEEARKQRNQQPEQREAKKKEPSCYLTKESCTVSGGTVSGGTVSGGIVNGGIVNGGTEICHATQVCIDEYGHETRKRVKTR